MQKVTVHQSNAGIAASMGGVGGYVQQSGQTNIYVAGRLTVTIEEVTSSVIVSEYHHTDGYVERVTDVVPADARHDYEQTVAWWVEFLTKREAATAASPAVTYNGAIVDAPGFTAEKFARGVAKARNLGYLQMVPMRNGVVRVDTGKAGSVYTVTRTSCTCKGHQGHGHCYHRAAVIFVNDVCGYEVEKNMILGFDPAGQPVTWTERQRQLKERRIARRKARIAA